MKMTNDNRDNRPTVSSIPPDAPPARPPEPPRDDERIQARRDDRNGMRDSVRDDAYDGRTLADEPVEAVQPGRPGVGVRDGDVDPTVPVAAVAAPRDSVRWGPVWAGLFTALTVFLVLELLAYGLGLLTTTTSAGVSASDASPWISGVLGLIAFFVGGFVAERSSAARGGGAGLLNGFMVWALGTGLILVLSALGLGSLFGALGSAIGQIATPGNVNPARVAEISQSVALGAFFSLVISAIAAALGGLLGSMGTATGEMRGRLINWR
ncbi:MAG TPA: TIGR04086 family membrane protein [Ktedonobacterales bacterium]|nr:TIGR04086 family membrane protein [Ktedonobacterales bacterium]